jgi:hypothetical protein
MTDDAEQVYLTPRGLGYNRLPCGWCHKPDQPNDMASFVKNQENGELALEILKEAGIVAELDLRRADEGRYQVKIGACDEHLLRLDFLGCLLSHMALTVPLVQRTTRGLDAG